MYRNMLFALVLGWLCLSSNGAFSQTSERNCDERIAKAEAALQQAVAHHGEHSREVQQRKQEIRKERRSCGVENPVTQLDSRETRDPKKRP